ncbi:MAG: class II aldolase/adducin family protein [Myxococcaceae bacterium]|jgi:L-fuculose-phosphate aldolase|nr:MAG: class II aldolase/adducin family protein [Myxococcaceae bacterium]
MMETRTREEIVRACGYLVTRGWVANHDGNASAKSSPQRYLCTPGATHKSVIRAQDLLVTDAAGKQLSGRGKTFSEYALHLAVYRSRKDVRAVIHAHPPFATALGASGRELVTFLPEAVVSLGAKVPLVPLAAPGAAAVKALEPFLAGHDAVLIAGNGVFAWGDDIEQALLRLELVEHLATIATQAQVWGGPQPLPQEMVAALLEARKKAFPSKG